MKTRLVKTDDGTTIECECGWVSSGWSTRKDADARRDQHIMEHDSGTPMPELADFRNKKG